jgi:nucleoside-diphosphate-sugar epimerase
MNFHGERILVIGANGQLGTELVEALAGRYGESAVLACDVSPSSKTDYQGPYKQLDVLDKDRLFEIMKQGQFTQVYHLAALLSARGEQQRDYAWKLNMEGLFYVLDGALQFAVGRVFWPSSIAAFGPTTPRHQTPQHTIMEPTTVYGISKQAGEQWCAYYCQKMGVDVRSLRYPGLIGYKSLPGGGTTDYAVDIYHKALTEGKYTCFLKKDTYLPMMYMPDALKATLDLMHADGSRIKIRTSYNLGGMSFSPEEVAQSIRKEIPDFSISYEPDFRQSIADSWPASIDDSKAQQDWDWKAEFDLDAMTRDMLNQLGPRFKKQ